MQAESPEGFALLAARIGDTPLRQPFYVDGDTDLVAVCRELSARGLTQALVRERPLEGAAGSELLGMFTTTDLRDALLLGRPPQQVAVREVAAFGLIEVSADADLFEALWLMLRHRVHRLVVRDGDRLVGVLDQLDLLAGLARHSHGVALQIDAAQDLAGLGAAAGGIERMVAGLAGGIGVDRVARLVGELNARLVSRLWHWLAPPDLVSGSCLLAMGSEGRGEQLLKTDQDNALLLPDGLDPAGLADLAEGFNAALVRLGWPACPGRIMINNPQWRQSAGALRETLRGWVHGDGVSGGGGDAEGAMRLAIFLDAAPLAGDAGLLVAAREHVDELVAGQEGFIARFARPALQFQEPGHWIARMARRDEAPLDLKKLGLFTIVHGVRALALQAAVHATGTSARLERLMALERIDARLGRDLQQALALLLGLRLAHQLRQRAAGLPLDNEVRVSELSTLDREALHEAQAIVKGLRQFLRLHFRLDAMG